MDPGVINPFSDDLFVDHSDNMPGVSQIHAQTFNRVVEAFESLGICAENKTPDDKLGRTILVTAPEAGFGKSHLAARLRDHLKTASTSVSLPLDPSRAVAWPVVLGAIIRQFSHVTCSRFEHTSLLAETGRHLLAQLAIQHLEAGNSLNCPETEANLRENFVSLFCSDSSSSILGWTDSHSRSLSHEVSAKFLETLGLTPSELGFWARLIIDFHWRGEAALEPLRGLTNGEARERLLQWLRLASFYRPLLIITDGLDGFFQSESAGMEIAGIVTGIRETVPRSVTFLSINEDIWESVFENRLPSAWKDRLTGEPQKLYPITPEAASELIMLRLKRTPIIQSAADEFTEKLKNDHLWIDSETTLSPRIVLRQANQLWESDATRYLSHEREGTGKGEEKSISELIDKADFFEIPQKGLPVSQPSVLEKDEASEGDRTQPADPLPKSLLPGLEAILNPSFRPTMLAEKESAPLLSENSFFAPTTPKETSEPLTGIDSVINDIRNSGKTVFSESAERPKIELPEREDLPEPSTSFQVGDLNITPAKGGKSRSPAAETGTSSDVVNMLPSLAWEPNKSLLYSEAAKAKDIPVSKAEIEARIKEKEREILSQQPIKLELSKVEGLLQKMGDGHLGLSQTEERYPSSRTTCLRWKVNGQSVLIGFESPRNVYFWNNLLQQSLSSNRQEKITSFSHPSESFDPSLFSSFGFSPSVIRGRIDAIEMSDEELAALYAAADVLTEFEGTANLDVAAQYIALTLDPLWRRISRPLQSQ